MSYFYKQLDKMLFRIKQDTGFSPGRIMLDAGIESSQYRAYRRHGRPFSDGMLEKLSHCPYTPCSLEEMKSWKLRDKFSLQEIKTALEPAGEGDESGQEVSAFRTFPCHGAISAHGVEVFNQPTDQQDCFHWLDPNHEPEITCLTVKDQSLSPRFNQGGLMIVREAETMTSGKTYLLEVLNDHGQLQIKAMTLNDELLEPLLPEESPVAASELVIKRRFELLKYAELFCAPPQA